MWFEFKAKFPSAFTFCICAELNGKMIIFIYMNIYLFCVIAQPKRIAETQNLLKTFMILRLISDRELYKTVRWLIFCVIFCYTKLKKNMKTGRDTNQTTNSKNKSTFLWNFCRNIFSYDIWFDSVVQWWSIVFFFISESVVLSTFHFAVRRHK